VFSSIFSTTLSISSHIEKTEYFHCFITIVSLSSNTVNSFATLFNAFKSLERNTHSSQTQTIIGLQSLTQTSILGFSLSITAKAYAQTSFLVTFAKVETISQSNILSINFATTSVSVSE
jgi:hypothetical protein